MKVYGLSEQGKVRQTNQDKFLIADLSKARPVIQSNLSRGEQKRCTGNGQGYLLMVTDGMGGHAAGEQASRIAVDTALQCMMDTMPWFFQLDVRKEDDLIDDLKEALKRCEEKIRNAIQSHPEWTGMGTTMTMAYVLWPRLYVIHAGDSRCYLLRGDRLEQMTKDHTMAQQMADQGILSPDQAQDSQWSHVLSESLGGNSNGVHPDVYKAYLEPGDVVLLCSDGLTKHVEDEQIASLLNNRTSAEESCFHLASAANKAGGSDNITAVVAHFDKPEPPVDLDTKKRVKHKNGLLGWLKSFTRMSHKINADQ